MTQEGTYQFNALHSPGSELERGIQKSIATAMREAVSVEEYEEARHASLDATANFLNGNISDAERAAIDARAANLPGKLIFPTLSEYSMALRLVANAEYCAEVLDHENEHMLAALTEEQKGTLQPISRYQIVFCRREDGRFNIYPSIVIYPDEKLGEDEKKNVFRTVTESPTTLSDGDKRALGKQ